MYGAATLIGTVAILIILCTRLPYTDLQHHWNKLRSKFGRVVRLYYRVMKSSN